LQNSLPNFHSLTVLYITDSVFCMIRWAEDCPIYLHRDPVDFRKAINGLAVIVSEELALDVYDKALFVFRDQLKKLC